MFILPSDDPYNGCVADYILPRYNDIFGYFTAISLYRESRYNDTSI